MRDGAVTVIAYSVGLSSSAENTLALRLTDFAYIEVNGQRPIPPSMRESLRPYLAAMSAVPVTILSADGSFIDVTDLDRVIDGTLAIQQVPPENHARARAALSSPRFRAIFAAKARATWFAWVEAWRDFDLSIAEGSRLEEDVALAAADGRPATMHVTTERLPNTSHGAVLRLTRRVEGTSLAAMLGPALQQIAAELGASLAGNPELRGGERTEVYEVETDPRTLRPLRTRREESTTLVFAAGTRNRTETKETAWDWAHAEGCGRPSRQP